MLVLSVHPLKLAKVPNCLDSLLHLSYFVQGLKVTFASDLYNFDVLSKYMPVYFHILALAIFYRSSPVLFL